VDRASFSSGCGGGDRSEFVPAHRRDGFVDLRETIEYVLCPYSDRHGGTLPAADCGNSAPARWSVLATIAFFVHTVRRRAVENGDDDAATLAGPPVCFGPRATVASYLVGEGPWVSTSTNQFIVPPVTVGSSFPKYTARAHTPAGGLPVDVSNRVATSVTASLRTMDSFIVTHKSAGATGFKSLKTHLDLTPHVTPQRGRVHDQIKATERDYDDCDGCRDRCFDNVTNISKR